MRPRARRRAGAAARRRLLALASAAALALVAGVGVGADDDPRRAPRERARRAGPRSRPTPSACASRWASCWCRASTARPCPPTCAGGCARARPPGVIAVRRERGARRQAGGALTAAVQRAARGAALVAVDQEGGEVRTRALRRAGEPARRRRATRPRCERLPAAAGSRLRALGVNVNLAPVADVSAGAGSVMAGRTFAGGPGEVAARTRAAVRGLSAARRRGATAKHFPGLGAAAVNTDDGPVDVAAPRAVLEARELVAVPGGGERRGPAGDALARALSGARPGADRLAVAPVVTGAAAPRGSGSTA